MTKPSDKKEDPPKDVDNPVDVDSSALNEGFVDVLGVGFVPAEDPDKKKESQADRLVRYALDQDLRLFVDQFNDPYARFCLRDELYVTYRLRSRDFKTFLAGLMWKVESKAPGNEAISSALNVLESMGREEGQIPLYNRVAPSDSGGIWIDMCDDSWRGIHVTASGWKVFDSVSMPVLFRRYAHQKPLPYPIRGGDASLLLDFANLRESGDRILYVVTTISYFVPDVPHIVLILHGVQGSGKTWALIAVRAVVDPSSLGVLALPRRDAELVQQLNHNYCAFYDNTGTIPTWISNALCRASTGTGFSKRVLYTDDDDFILQFRRCCGLTDINIAAERGDLLDRSVLLGFEAISKSERRTDKDLAEDLERKAPRILGGILDILSKALAIYPTLELDGLFRMADYHRWGVAISKAMGLNPQDFIDAYAENVERQSIEAIKASPIAEVLIAFMAGQEDGTWKGTATQLYGFLDETAQAMNISTRQKAWAKTPTVLSRRLNELIPSLPAVGIHIKKTREGKDRTRLISINVVPSVRSVRPEEKADGKDAKDAIVTNKKASELYIDDRDLATKTVLTKIPRLSPLDARALAIKAILTREGGEISESKLNFELLLEDMDFQDLETQLKHLEFYGYIDRAPDTVKLGRTKKGIKLSDLNITPMGLQVYSLSFGEAISKGGRHLLCLLCLESIEKDLIGEGKFPAPKGRGRGRPRSPATILANRVNVSYDTVRRWADLEKIQSCDANAVILARVAFEYDPEETIKILRQDVECHRLAIEDWVRQVDHQIGAGKLPPPLDKTQNIVAGACDENTGIDKLNIAYTNAVPRALCIQTQDNEKRVVRITA